MTTPQTPVESDEAVTRGIEVVEGLIARHEGKAQEIKDVPFMNGAVAIYRREANDMRAVLAELTTLRAKQAEDAARFDAEDVAFLRRLADSEESRFTARGLFIPNEIPRDLRDLADRLAARSAPVLDKDGTNGE